MKKTKIVTPQVIGYGQIKCPITRETIGLFKVSDRRDFISLEEFTMGLAENKMMSRNQKMRKVYQTLINSSTNLDILHSAFRVTANNLSRESILVHPRSFDVMIRDLRDCIHLKDHKTPCSLKKKWKRIRAVPVWPKSMRCPQSREHRFLPPELDVKCSLSLSLGK